MEKTQTKMENNQYQIKTKREIEAMNYELSRGIRYFGNRRGMGLSNLIMRERTAVLDWVLGELSDGCIKSRPSALELARIREAD